MNIYPALLRLTGLNHQEAADFHKITKVSVSSWSRGAFKAPESRNAELHGLLKRQKAEAERIMDGVQDRFFAGDKFKGKITIRFYKTDGAAQLEGWPCKAAHDTAIALALASLPLEILSVLSFIDT